MTKEEAIFKANRAILDSGAISVGTYRNLKNNKEYSVIAVGQDSETGMANVIYRDSAGDVWIRPYLLFLQKFERVSKLD